jgi:hypothetical protein
LQPPLPSCRWEIIILIWYKWCAKNKRAHNRYRDTKIQKSLNHLY